RSAITGPSKAARPLGGPTPARDARPDVTEATWRCARHSPTPSLSVFAQARGVSVVSGRPASAPGRRGRGPPPRRTRPPPPTHGRPRRQFEPPPREPPHSAEAPAPPLPLPLLPVCTSAPRDAAPGRGARPGPAFAVAAGLNPGPVERRARATPGPRPYLRRRCLLEPRPRETP